MHFSSFSFYYCRHHHRLLLLLRRRLCVVFCCSRILKVTFLCNFSLIFIFFLCKNVKLNLYLCLTRHRNVKYCLNYRHNTNICWSQGNSVLLKTVTTGVHSQREWGIGSFFFSPHPNELWKSPSLLSNECREESSCPELYRPGREANRFLPSSAEMNIFLEL